MDLTQAPTPLLPFLTAGMEVSSVKGDHPGIPVQQGLGGDLHSGSLY